MTILDRDEALQMWGAVVQDAFLNDPFHGWLIEQTKVVQKHAMKKLPSISVSGVEFPPPPEFPKTISTGRSGWWGRNSG
jgi:hypothetical protein